MTDDDRGLDIVFVDQCALATIQARELLARAGISVAVAKDTDDALELVRRHDPHMILFAPRVADGDAVLVASAMGAAHRFRHFSLIVLCDQDDCDPLAAARLGVTDIIKLPIDWQQLAKRLQLRLIADRRARATELLCRSRERFLDQAGVAGFTIDKLSHIVRLPTETRQLLGISPDTDEFDAGTHWHKLLDFVSPDDRDAVREGVLQTISDEVDCFVSFQALDTQTTFRLHGRGRDERNPGRQTADFTVQRTDAVRLQPAPRAQRAVERAESTHRKDVLQVLREVMAGREEGAVLVVHVADISRTYHQFGYETGMRMLRVFGDQLVASMRDDDSVMPLSEDYSENRKIVAQIADVDFAIVLRGIADPERVGRITKRLRERLGREIIVDGRKLPISLKFGTAIWPADGTTPDEVLRVASLGTSSRLPDVNATFRGVKAAKHFDLEAALHDAVDKEELSLEYQPKFSASDLSIVGLESLLRWRYRGKSISPGTFIPMAERSGLIREIGRWVVDQVTRQYAQWASDSLQEVPIAFNVSADEFNDPAFVDNVLAACSRNGVDPSCLELEITESSVLLSDQNPTEKLVELREAGLSIALDDFGTGYSSLSYLRKLSIDALKIDRSFVADLPADSVNCGLIVGIIGLGTTLGLRVVAEGVEREEQRDLLREWGCHELQGFLLSRPLPAEDVARLLARKASDRSLRSA